jgi:hypothetical protein
MLNRSISLSERLTFLAAVLGVPLREMAPKSSSGVENLVSRRSK